jgi:hypothetical protein
MIEALILVPGRNALKDSDSLQFLKLFQFPESLETLGSPQKQIVVFAVMANRQCTRKRAYQLPGHS